MKSTATAIILLLGLASVAAAKVPLPESGVRSRILELVKEDARKKAGETNERARPPPESALNDQPIAEGVLELKPIVVREKKPFVLHPRLKLTLDNFFYGDGKIFESAGRRVSLSAGPEGKGLAAIKFNIRF